MYVGSFLPDVWVFCSVALMGFRAFFVSSNTCVHSPLGHEGTLNVLLSLRQFVTLKDHQITKINFM